MPPDLLLDTGAWVALLDRGNQRAVLGNRMRAGIEVRDLTRVFYTFDRREGLRGAVIDLIFPRKAHPVFALRGVNLTVPFGQCVGLLGPNGAGKSTFIKILAGVLHPTHGEVRVNGLDPWKDRYRHRRSIGVLFGHRSQLWWNIPVSESLRFLAEIYGVKREEFRRTLTRLRELLDLDPLLPLPPRELSLGQRMRCELAASLIHSPAVLLLDEPTIGLDLLARIRLRSFLRDLAATGDTTILFSSHDLLDVEGVASRIVVLDKGQVLFDGTLDELRAQYTDFTARVTVYLDEPASWSLRDRLSQHGELDWDPNEPWVLKAKVKHVLQFMQELTESSTPRDVRIEQPSIEEVVLALYGNKAPPDRA